MDFLEYKNSILEYLRTEKYKKEVEIDIHRNLSRAEKIDAGLLIPMAKVTEDNHPEYIVSVSDNLSRLRPGDKVKLLNVETDKLIFDVIVVENKENQLHLLSKKELEEGKEYDILVDEVVMMDSLIKSVESIEDGTGVGFLNTLAGTMPPINFLRGGLSRFAELKIPKNFNTKQIEACTTAFKRPTLLCIQGTPGSGKTHLLSIIAQAYSSESKEVLIVSLTHQAVNNALNKIKETDSKLPVFKIGDGFRSEGLKPTIHISESYNDYLAYRKSKKKKRGEPGDILGMTLHAATINLGIRTTGYQPMIVLVDEAGQIPLTHAANIGSFGCGSVILIGDHEQMPPIYANGMEDNPLSVSIFEHLMKLYPEKSITLNTTYRMNEEITSLCSRNFYEPHGVQLISSDFSKNRKLLISSFNEEQNEHSVTYILDESSNVDSQEMNIEEANTAANIVRNLYEQGLTHKDVAVITPFRLQTRTIRERVASILPDGSDLPLIDTVERLQGQDVDCIIISFSVSDKKYLNKMESFLFQPNRLNVMISRAKKKVIFLMSQSVFDIWNNNFK